mmetsp:Transcript_15913/g.43172  ORF Transcript_15913/g.43172 Transcript_15913/m.43172 type:complete len:184 (-) Transcript_15913:417-968(-)
MCRSARRSTRLPWTSRPGDSHTRGPTQALSCGAAAVSPHTCFCVSLRTRCRPSVGTCCMLPGRRRPVKSGARLNVVIDMQIRELTIELLDTKGTIASSITVEGIPGEVAVAVSFGPGRHAVRLVGNETEKPAMKLLGKLRKDLWDDENVIAPMALNVKKGSDAARGSSMRVKAAEMAEAMMLE